jgi:hypothetical protein
MDWLAGMLLVTMALLPVLTALALPPLAVALPPPMARAVDWLADLAVLELTPTPTAVWAMAGPTAINAMAVVASSLFMKSPMDGWRTEFRRSNATISYGGAAVNTYLFKLWR